MATDTPISLEKLPKSFDIHTWADYIELLCLINKDRVISKGDILDRIRDESDDSLNSEDDEEDRAHEITLAESRDKEELKVDDWFRHLIYRSGAFDRLDFYPFYIAKDGDGLQLKDDLTPKHKFYIFLLLASNLRYVPHYKHQITTTFEFVSHKALKSLFPSSAEVHIFGTSTGSSGRYSGNLLNKATILSQDLCERLLINETTFSKHNSGDKGLDIVGWVPTGDEVGGVLSVFAQCACTEEWVDKQNFSKVSAWRSMMTFTVPPSNLIFIPFCFRNSTGGWWQVTDIHESIVIDRVRLTYFLKEGYEMLQGFPVSKSIDGILNYKEPLV